MKNSGYTLVELIIGIVLIVILLSFVGCGVLCVRGCKAVQSKGVKGVAESVWHGTNGPTPVNTNDNITTSN